MMNARESQLLSELTGNEPPVECLCSDTKIDTGLWWRQTPVWACVTGDQLILLAVSKRRFVEQFDLGDITESYYNHATGEFLIEPNEGLELPALKFSVRDALTLLKHIKPTNAASVA